MKWLILSDSHGAHATVQELIEAVKPDEVFHAGDSEISAHYDDYYLVKGNSYLEPDVPEQIIADVDGFRVLLTHGHLYRIHNGMSLLLEEAKKQHVDIVIFGHSHVYMDQMIDGIRFINPGSISRPRDGVASCLIFDTMSQECNRFKVGDVLNGRY